MTSDADLDPKVDKPSPINLSPRQKASVLVEALPWLQRFAGSVVVVKYDGNSMLDDNVKKAFAQDLVFLRAAGIRPVVVHGGGPQISAMLGRLGIEYEFLGGLRVTTPQAMEVVRMVLVGQVGRELIGLINAYGALAVGLSGEDGGLLQARRRGALVEDGVVDIGLVGEVIDVKPAALLDLIHAGRIPVVSTVAPDADGQVLNVDASAAAAALAIALSAAKLLVLTSEPGVGADGSGQRALPSQITADELEPLMSGMEPGLASTMTACLSAVRGGVPEATVIDGRAEHSVLLEVFTPEGVGTMVLPSAPATTRDGKE